ncbi:MAG TPA: flagellar hook-associated protein FlgK [Bryobacteraceae bacterium]|nr:Flagellar hook-associated protein FlgK [Candidatus Sulfopaludibacter sp. SbA4]HYW44149.1 flagellar hook-associated protein FlgK [Bryobacteraceae bacterium]
MGNILATLGSSAGALDAIDQVLQVTQNNVANASTPGYAKQSLVLEAMPFDLTTGATGGVRAGQVQSSRDQYAEQAVRSQTTLLGNAQQNVTSLTSLQSLFDVTGQSGIPLALNNLFQSFSAWAQSPSDTVARQTVLQQATSLASAFQQTATGLAGAQQQTQQQLQGTVDQINQLVGQLQGFNTKILQGSRNDPSLDAEVNSTLEQLSQYADITSLQQPDGTVTVLMNGQTPLLVAGQQYRISYRLAGAATPLYAGHASAQITAADGTDITAQTTGGQLGALLNIRNTVIPSYLGDSSQAGSLNILAKTFADRVNTLLTPVDNSSGTPVQTGVPIFTYDTTNDTNVAQTLAVDPQVAPDQLTAVDPGPPGISNGVPLALSAMSNGTDSADQIDGDTYNQYFGGMASAVGSALNQATGQQTVQQAAVAQAQNLRQQTSGVSLDEEATLLVQFQRAYDANSRLISVLDQISLDAINIIQPGTA